MFRSVAYESVDVRIPVSDPPVSGTRDGLLAESVNVV
jgi:hypothetical protein